MSNTPENLAVEVITYCGGGDLTQATSHTKAVLGFVRAYTRGNGFTAGEPNDELATVVVTAAARTMANPEAVQAQADGPFTRSYFRWNGFNLMEQAVLHQYRRRTA
ncbi:MAG: hypothetical protein ACK5KO_12960 [Arachnia sp.]